MPRRLKWLKNRKDCKLEFGDILHYHFDYDSQLYEIKLYYGTFPVRKSTSR